MGGVSMRSKSAGIAYLERQGLLVPPTVFVPNIGVGVDVGHLKTLEERDTVWMVRADAEPGVRFALQNLKVNARDLTETVVDLIEKNRSLQIDYGLIIQECVRAS